MSDNNPLKWSEKDQAREFNYYFLAKALIAIPAIPMIGAIIAGLFKDPVLQFIMSAYSGAIVILVTQRIDRLRIFSPIIFDRKPK